MHNSVYCAPRPPAIPILLLEILLTNFVIEDTTESERKKNFFSSCGGEDDEYMDYQNTPLLYNKLKCITYCFNPRTLNQRYP